MPRKALRRFPNIPRRQMDAQEAITSLTKTHGSRAGGEALRRAWLAERAGEFARARFWLAVYCGIHVARAEAADPSLAAPAARTKSVVH